MAKTDSKLSAVEIAKRQRYLFLLQKVKQNKTLSKAELLELKRYERRAAGQVTAKAKTTAKRVKKKASAKVGKKRRGRPPLREAEVRKLALRCEDVAAADSETRTRSPLALILRRFPRLKKAWDRGRFLRRVRDLASQAPSIAQAASHLGFSEQRFQELLNEDMEVADIWKEEQLKLYVETRRQVFELAQNDAPWAKKCVYDLITTHPEAGLKANILEIGITTDQLAKLTKKSIQTIYNWVNKFGLPRKANKTFDLSIFLAWYEEFLLKKLSGGDAAVISLDPLKTIKAEKLRVELARHQNELLERQEVICSLVAWAQHIVSFCDRGNEELSRLCIGQPREKIKEIHKRFFQDLHAGTARVPKELHLPDDKEKELVEFLQGLKPYVGLI